MNVQVRTTAVTNDDPRFQAFPEKAARLHAMKPLVFIGTPVFERRHHSE